MEGEGGQKWEREGRRLGSEEEGGEKKKKKERKKGRRECGDG